MKKHLTENAIIDIGMAYNRTASAVELATKYNVTRARIYILVSKLRKMGANICDEKKPKMRDWKNIVLHINSAFPEVKKSKFNDYGTPSSAGRVKKFKLWN